MYGVFGCTVSSDVRCHRMCGVTGCTVSSPMDGVLADVRCLRHAIVGGPSLSPSRWTDGPTVPCRRYHNVPLLIGDVSHCTLCRNVPSRQAGRRTLVSPVSPFFLRENIPCPFPIGLIGYSSTPFFWSCLNGRLPQVLKPQI